jgi:hypothetical protein
LLAVVEQGLDRVADKPALLEWGDEDPAFQTTHRPRWENTFNPADNPAPIPTARKPVAHP